MKRKHLILALLAIVLVLGAAIGPAMAYFSTYTTASGRVPIELGDETEIEERWLDWTKQIAITNQKGQPVFVRARAYSGMTYPATTDATEDWYRDGDWWYYRYPVAAGDTATGLSVHVNKVPAGMGEGYEPAIGENFNVVIIYESTPVQYREDGTPFADWEMVLDIVTEGGQG